MAGRAGAPTWTMPVAPVALTLALRGLQAESALHNQARKRVSETQTAAASKSSGDGSLGQRGRATLEEVAELAGVSRATVSRVINGKPRVSRETRVAVERAATRLGYVPNRPAP